MVKGFFYTVLVVMLGLFLSAGVADAAKSVDVKKCYECHDQIQEFHEMNKHADVNCVNCHSKLQEHLIATEEGKTFMPSTTTDHEACGKCHEYQYDTFMTHNYASHARSDKGDPKGRSPYWEIMIAPYLFALEHNEPRSHKYMLIDHLIVDRAYAGKFKLKNTKDYVYKGAPKAWDVLYDAYPGQAVVPKKPFLKETGWAGNSVCLLCKTSDDILDWPYKGDPKKGAKFDRTTPAYIKAKSLSGGLPCIHCHDPHAAKHRIVRDALIEAITTRDDTLWHEGYPNKANLKVYTMGLRGFDRKIAILDKPDPLLQCGQCHVEYTCNPIVDTATGKKAGMADPRSNHFPFVTLAKIDGDKIVEETFWNHLNEYKYRDFKHIITKAPLWKSQHPEVEVFYNSKHALAGVTCTDCHTPEQESRGGKVYSSHWHVSPRDIGWKPCLNCHPEWTAEDAEYITDSIRNYSIQKMRKAEVWGTHFIERFQDAQDHGVSEKTLKKARNIHDKAHMYWEWWTSENSDGFHNPELARVTLGESISLFKDGIKLLDKAIANK